MTQGLHCALIVALLGSACGAGLPDPPVDQLRQPTGLAVTPDGGWLLVTGGNLDHRDAGGAVWAIDLDRLKAALDGSAGSPGAALSAARPCRQVSDTAPTLECDAKYLIDSSATVFVGTGAGNIGVDQPSGEVGPFRLLIPVRDPANVTWIDARVDAGEIELRCGQGERRTCDQAHQISELSSDSDTPMPPDPVNLFVDQQARYAYVPHLIDGALSLVVLDGQAGPELTDVESDFFREGPFDEVEIRGGFAVTRRACDPANPILGSSDCSRPYMFSSQRYWPGIREFAIASGLDVVQGRTETALLGFDAELVELRPFMGDLEFQDPATGEDLLIVHTTPAGLSRVDTSLDEDGQPRAQLRGTVALCANPNMLDVVRVGGSQDLAFVTCFGDDRVAVVGLGAFALVAEIPLGKGPNELAEDLQRGWMFVANTGDDTLSVVGTDPLRSGFLTEIARVGLGGEYPVD